MNIEQSQMEFMRAVDQHYSLPSCGFGNNNCAYPSCSCGSEKEPPIQFAGPEPVQRDSFRSLALYCLGSAAVTVAVIVLIAGVFG